MKKAFVCLALMISVYVQAQSPLIKKLDSLTAAYETNGYHGVIRVAKGDDLIYEKAYGFANFEKKIKFTPSTLSKTESAGKMFTSVAVLQLVEQGKLTLDQSLKSLLPELNIKNAEKITIHHLLNHTSGIQSPWDHPNWKFKNNYSRKELETIIEEVPLAFDSVGKEMYYSNSGYYLLSWIVEKVTGMSYDKYYKKQIFDPLGMKNTWHLGDTIMPEKNGAQPYRLLSSKKYIPMTETVGAYASGAGGWISTAEDFQKFMSALQGGKLIKPSTLEMMRTANNNRPKQEAYRFYAYGLEIYKNQMIPGFELYGHNGGGAGFAADAFAEPESGYIVTSTNNLYLNSRSIMENYFRAVLGQPLKPVTKSSTVAVYDIVEEKGISLVLNNADSIFKQLNINAHPGWLAMMAETF
ncbi:MAG TPA: serine hydrolase domain-containing protein, partial [Chitinophagaceae bacterium]